ncbi:MAG: hypothetical protein KC656_03860 [Myxococcales bacterium]|nr:hypothetical protein [Myxococcales bacterium]
MRPCEVPTCVLMATHVVTTGASIAPEQREVCEAHALAHNNAPGIRVLEIRRIGEESMAVTWIDKVIRWVTDHPGCTAKEIRTGTGYHNTSSVLSGLVSSERLERDDDTNRYYAPGARPRPKVVAEVPKADPATDPATDPANTGEAESLRAELEEERAARQSAEEHLAKSAAKVKELAAAVLAEKERADLAVGRSQSEAEGHVAARKELAEVREELVRVRDERDASTKAHARTSCALDVVGSVVNDVATVLGVEGHDDPEGWVDDGAEEVLLQMIRDLQKVAWTASDAADLQRERDDLKQELARVRQERDELSVSYAKSLTRPEVPERHKLALRKLLALDLRENDVHLVSWVMILPEVVSAGPDVHRALRVLLQVVEVLAEADRALDAQEGRL